ncbi:YEATS domain-containing protein 2 [Cloeon dipterum]|uniref:YEATS domain-containing protein 2 n=1 Tax=Cloeon dipterum TaxID=197152 RepID=UPI00321F828B
MQCHNSNLEDEDFDLDVQEPECKRIKVERDGDEGDLDWRVYNIINDQFNKEINAWKDKVIEIQDLLSKGRQNLSLMRYVATKSYYRPQPSKQQSRIHPAVKKLLGSKKKEEILIDVDVPETLKPIKQEPKGEKAKQTEVILSKTPCYIPPKEKPGSSISVSTIGRSLLGKEKHTIVVGNVSKWIMPEDREGESTHKWMLYVRGPPDAPDLSNVVQRVRFFLHSSYKPHDVIEVNSSPFHLSRRGWGEFPVRVQIHFFGPQNKSIEIIHNLALDKTYTGRQTLGGETKLDVWIVKESPLEEKQLSLLKMTSPVKTEPETEAPPEPSPSKKVEAKVPTSKSMKMIHTVPKAGAPKQIIIPSLSNRTFIIPANAGQMSGQRVITIKSASQLGTRASASQKGVSLLKPNVANKGSGPRQVIYLKLNGSGKLIPIIAPFVQPTQVKSPTTPQVKTVHSQVQFRPVINSKAVLPLPPQNLAKSEKLQAKKSYIENYEKLAVKCTDSFDVAACALLRSLPLIDKDLAENEVYCSLHSYMIPSTEAFMAMPVGKQRAHEMLRAKDVLKCLQKQGFQEKNPWTIAKLARAYGFTPITNCCERTVSTLVPSVYKNCYSEDSDIINWLTSNCNNYKKLDQEAEVDVEHIRNEQRNKGAKVVPENMTKLSQKSVFIRSIAKKIGIRFDSEDDNEPNNGEAEHVIYECALQLMEELLRRSRFEAMKRGSSECIALKDVQGALQQRQEFDLFRNDGLGSPLER